MKRLKQLFLSRAGVTVVTLLLVTSGLAAAPGYRLIGKKIVVTSRPER